jgi:hypothetical protein
MHDRLISAKQVELPAWQTRTVPLEVGIAECPPNSIVYVTGRSSILKRGVLVRGSQMIEKVGGGEKRHIAGGDGE